MCVDELKAGIRMVTELPPLAPSTTRVGRGWTILAEAPGYITANYVIFIITRPLSFPPDA